MSASTPSMVAGEHETLAGDMLTVEGEGEDFTIGDATVVCGNVQTANATVYVVDQVLMPADVIRPPDGYARMLTWTT